MTRRQLLASAALPLVPAARGQARPPNFLVVVADDHGWDDLGCYAHPVVETPNLDRMAAEGVRFTDAFTAAPLCSPGRGAVMTGLYPHVSGVTHLVQRQNAEKYSMRRDLWTFARGLKELGYETAASNKWHLSTAGATAHGFDHAFADRQNYLQPSIEFLERAHDNPFCFYFCPTHTHRRYREHADFPYKPEDVAECLPPYLKDTPQVRQHYAWYLSETSKMDQEIGSLLAAIERAGEMDNTVVVYLTDHGPSMHRAKFSLYDWGTHSSLIFRGPGVTGSGRVINGLASTIDVGPTLMSLAGGEAPAGLQGVDLTPRLGDRSEEFRKYVFSEHNEGNRLTAIRSERFKLIRNHTRTDRLVPEYVVGNWQDMGEDVLRVPYPLPRPAEELYDLAADPLESRNLAGSPSYSAARNQLHRELLNWETTS